VSGNIGQEIQNFGRQEEFPKFPRMKKGVHRPPCSGRSVRSLCKSPWDTRCGQLSLGSCQAPAQEPRSAFPGEGLWELPCPHRSLWMGTFQDPEEALPPREIGSCFAEHKSLPGPWDLYSV
jgi:hypothetical protein